jgi:predicted Zn-dependent protease
VRDLGELTRAAEQALGWACAQPGVSEVEAFVSANAALLTRLNYTSHVPCNGVEEPKSVESFGIGLQVVFDAPGGRRLGFGSEPSDLSAAGIERAFDKARRAAVTDPDFVSLPRSLAASRALTDYHDPALMRVSDERLVEAGWTIVGGALRTFLASSRLADLAGSEEALRRLGLIVGGDVTIVQERMAIASTAMPRVQTDETTLITAFVTSMVEAHAAKGSGWSTGTRLDDFSDEAGGEAAQAAIAAVGGARVPSGRYTVVFGRQPVTDILNDLVLPACNAETFYASASPFLGRLGRRVASPALSIYDHGAMPGMMGSKGITCEGLPTGRTDLIRDGVLTGCLSCWYETERLLRDPQRAEKLGGPDDAARTAALVPRNGFRFGAGGGRQFASRPSIAATNVVVEGADPVGHDELLRRVGDGLYIGRIWYTYPINGLRAGDFTCTVTADSYMIRGGRIAEPIQANTIRINDNIATFLNNVVGVTKDVKGTIVWAADEVVYAPEIAVSDVRIDAIARGESEGGV